MRDVDQFSREQLLKRVGIFQNFEKLFNEHVCKDHLEYMTTKFEKKVNEYRCCLWPSHGDSLRKSRCTTKTSMDTISIEISKAMQEKEKYITFTFTT